MEKLKSGIKPATFLLVAQCLNQLRQRVPRHICIYSSEFRYSYISLSWFSGCFGVRLRSHRLHITYTKAQRYVSIEDLFQAPAAKQMSSALFWDVNRRIAVIPYRRISENLPVASSRFMECKNFLTLEDGTGKLSRNVGQDLALCAASCSRGAQISLKMVTVLKLCHPRCVKSIKQCI